jgi:hypothetical protein
LNRKGDLSVHGAAARDADKLAKVLLVPMHDGIGQRLMERGFNVQLAPVRISESRNEVHDLIYEWRDDRDLTGERLSQFNERNRTKL